MHHDDQPRPRPPHITVTDLTASRVFYHAVLSTIGVEELFDIPAAGNSPAMVGYGQDPKPFFWLIDGEVTDPNLHLAFAVDSRRAVDDFYTAAIAAGATPAMNQRSTRSITPTTTGHSSTTPTAPTSKPSATTNRET